MADRFRVDHPRSTFRSFRSWFSRDTFIGGVPGSLVGGISMLTIRRREMRLPLTPLLLIVVITYMVGWLTYGAAISEIETQSTQSVVVRAQAIERLPMTVGGGRIPVQTGTRFHVRWTGPDGVSHAGHTVVPPGTQVGSEIQVLVDQETGELVVNTTSHDDAIARTISAVVLTIVSGSAVVAVLQLRSASANPSHTIETEWREVAADWRRRYL